MGTAVGLGFLLFERERKDTYHNFQFFVASGEDVPLSAIFVDRTACLPSLISHLPEKIKIDVWPDYHTNTKA